MDLPATTSIRTRPFELPRCELRDTTLESLTEEVRIFTTDERLEYPDDVGWDCYHDELAAFIDVRRFIVLYHGYDRYWG